jgi:hypothetical protein
MLARATRRYALDRAPPAAHTECRGHVVLGEPTSRGSTEALTMTNSDVQELFRRALTRSDPAAMREGLERLFAHGTPDALSPEAEWRLRHEDYVMEMPQSGEHIRGRDAMRAMQEAFPTPPSITLRRVVGAGTVWVVEGVNDYDGDVWHVVLVLELVPDGRIVRDTRYYARAFPAPEWRSSWVERL